jgi:hypothetical protein
MAKKRKKKLTATTLVKAQAREVVGTPPASRPLPDRRADVERKGEKHKKSLVEIAGEE